MKSMTGFGRGDAQNGGLSVSVEIKTVNHRFFTPSIRMDYALSPLEAQVRQKVEASISRGKIDIFIHLHNHSSQGNEFWVNEAKGEAYIRAIRELAQKLNLPDDLKASALMRVPDLFDTEDQGEVDDEKASLLFEALTKALTSLDNMRIREGKALCEDLKAKLALLRDYTQTIQKLSPGVPLEYREKLEDRLKEYIGEDANRMPDPVRLSQEMTLFADRCCIDEELTRLSSHFSQFEKLMASSEPIGKQLDFLVQELNRETNTIASKSNNLEITKAALAMKNEIEKIREQIQNLE